MRTIKTLGIATAMALALIAVAGASMASANNFKANVESTNWGGSLSGKNHTLTLEDSSGNSEQSACSSVAFSGQTTKKTSSDLTVTPQLGNCSYLGYSLGWAINGCKYRFHAGAGPSLVGSVDIVGCEKPMTLSIAGCTKEIGNQNGIGTVEYKNVGAGTSVTFIAHLTGIKFTVKGCIGISSGTFYKGSYNGEWTVKGTTAGGAAASVEVESTSAAPITKFAAEEAPVTIAGVGSTSSTTYFKTIGGNLTNCKSYTLSGTAASVTSEEITLKPTYKECTVSTHSVPDGYVSAGSCSYVFHANGKFDIAGASCASNPMTITQAGCLVTIGPQSGLSSGFKFVNEGSGKLRAIALSGTSGPVVAYTATGPLCTSQGASTGGQIFSTAKLSATNSKGEPQGISIE
jgi:hypothetical protein